MDESQNAEEDLLAFLQPLKMPDEFTFETRARHFEDSSDDDAVQESIPGPAPPAPMAPITPVASAVPVAPMAPMDPIDAIEAIEPVAPVAPEAAMTEPNGAASLLPPETNAHKEDKTAAEQDDDAIEYETPKPTRKSPAKRPTKSRPTPRARPDDGDESSHDSAAELMKKFVSFSAKKRVQTKSGSENEFGANGGGPAGAGQSNSAGFEVESSPEPCKFEVVIKPLSPTAAQEYTKVDPGDEIYRVLEVIKTDIPGEAWLSVEFEDGRVDQVRNSYGAVSLHFKQTRKFDAIFIPSSHFLWQRTKRTAANCCLSVPSHRPPLPFHFFPLHLPPLHLLDFPSLHSHNIVPSIIPQCAEKAPTNRVYHFWEATLKQELSQYRSSIEHTNWGPRLHITRYFFQYAALPPQS